MTPTVHSPEVVGQVMLTVLDEINEARFAGLSSHRCADLESFRAKDLAPWIAQRTGFTTNQVKGEITRAGELRYMHRWEASKFTGLRSANPGWGVTERGRLVLVLDDPTINVETVTALQLDAEGAADMARARARLTSEYLQNQNWDGRRGVSNYQPRAVIAEQRADRRHNRMARRAALHRFEVLATRSDKGLPCHREFVRIIAGLPTSAFAVWEIIKWANRINGPGATS